MSSYKPSKIKLLMVCLGNICRSPLAQGILETKLPSDKFFVDSAGTANYHIGEMPDPRSIHVARQHNIDISNQRARQFSTEDFEHFDIIFAMDQNNYENIIRLTNNNKHIAKVKLILDNNPNISSRNVPDPYYGGDSGFKTVFDMLDETCNILAQNLLK